jgi:uncharacterized protein YndB with AHSA1/START domain
VSRTVRHPREAVWALLTSPEGTALWLGEGVALPTEPGTPYETADGTRGELRSRREHDRIRLTWQPPGWSHDSTVQVALSGAGGKTTLRFHQERLADSGERERQRTHWKAVAGRVEAALERA